MPATPQRDFSAGQLMNASASSGQGCRQLRSDRDDAGGIERRHRVVSGIDVVEVDGFLHAGQAQDALHVGGKARVVGDAAQVSLEEAMVGGVEAD